MVRHLTAKHGSASAVLVNLATLRQTSFFNETLCYGEDFDLWLRLAYLTPMLIIDKPLVFIRDNPKSATRHKSWERDKAFMYSHLFLGSQHLHKVTLPKLFVNEYIERIVWVYSLPHRNEPFFSSLCTLYQTLKSTCPLLIPYIGETRSVFLRQFAWRWVVSLPKRVFKKLWTRFYLQLRPIAIFIKRKKHVIR